MPLFLPRVARGTFDFMPIAIRRTITVASTAILISAHGATAAVVTPPPAAISSPDLWHDLSPEGLGSNSQQSIAPVALDNWTISITNASANSWTGFELRFSQDDGGSLLNFVTHFEPRFTAGVWSGGVLQLDRTFAHATFTASIDGFQPLAAGESVVLQVPVFNLTDGTQLYHLQIMAISDIPSPAAVIPMMLLLTAQSRRRSALART